MKIFVVRKICCMMCVHVREYYISRMRGPTAKTAKCTTSTVRICTSMTRQVEASLYERLLETMMIHSYAASEIREMAWESCNTRLALPT